MKAVLGAAALLLVALTTTVAYSPPAEARCVARSRIDGHCVRAVPSRHRHYHRRHYYR